MRFKSSIADSPESHQSYIILLPPHDVLVIVPFQPHSGPIRTPLLMDFLNTPEKLNRRLVHCPMGRFGEAVEQAKAVVFRMLSWKYTRTS
jgi:hypothetical protein